MFGRLKKVFGQDGAASAPPGVGGGPVSGWAASRGLSYAAQGDAGGFVLTGAVGSRPWKLERGKASRDYIRGEELRARAELKINDEVSVLVMNRPLKESLEKRAYEMYTDTLQTTADPSLPEEMRWLALYPEAGWSSLPDAFWARYSVMADNRDHAMAWVEPALAGLLMSWPEPGPDPQLPFILMLMRGKAYLRMQYSPPTLATLDHAARIFTTACETAVGGLSTDIAL